MKEDILDFINDYGIGDVDEVNTFEFEIALPTCTICEECISVGEEIFTNTNEGTIYEDFNDAEFIVCEDCANQIKDELENLVEF